MDQEHAYYNKSTDEIKPLPDTEDSATPAAKVDQPGNPSVGSVGGIGQIEGQSHNPPATDQKESPVDRAARLTATATVWIAIFTVVMGLVAIGTLYEIIEGGTDTHTLAEAAKKQAEKADTIATSIAQAVTQLTASATTAQQQVQAARNSVESIQRQTFQTERPWIAIDIVPASEFTYDETRGAIITLKFTLTNDGHSLAKYVSVWTQLAMNEHWREAQESICAAPKADRNPSSDYGYLMFPGQVVIDSIPAAARPEDIKRALATTPFQGGGAVSFDVVACVDYISIIDNRHHQTKIVRGMTYADQSRGGMLMGAFVPKRQYQLILIRRLHGDSAD
jgi:hypothetical protein